jgi:hypothetical protein
MRFNAARAVAAAGLLMLAAACSGGGAARTAAGHSAPPHQAVNAAKAVPAPIVMRGTLGTNAANTVYEAAIVPAYLLAVRLAGALTMQPAAAPTAVSDFSSRLTKALASFAAVTAFPSQAQASFAGYRSQAQQMLLTLAKPATVMASEQSRRQAALQLYALAQQIGVLGVDLNLVPRTEQGGKH